MRNGPSGHGLKDPDTAVVEAMGQGFCQPLDEFVQFEQVIDMAPTPSVKPPHIAQRKDRCGGQPVIKGTKFPVRSVVAYVLQQGMTPEELVERFPHVSLAQVYDALSYYYDHKDQIDRDLLENTEAHWRSRV